MKLMTLIIFSAIAASQPVLAADDRSPYDKNPACMDRNVDSTQSDCVIKDDGTPRQKYPPRTAPVATPKPAAPAGQPSAVLRGAAGR